MLVRPALEPKIFIPREQRRNEILLGARRGVTSDLGTYTGRSWQFRWV